MWPVQIVALKFRISFNRAAIGKFSYSVNKLSYL